MPRWEVKKLKIWRWKKHSKKIILSSNASKHGLAGSVWARSWSENQEAAAAAPRGSCSSINPTHATASPLSPPLKESITLPAQVLQSPPGSSQALCAIIVLCPSCPGSQHTEQSRVKSNFCTLLDNFISKPMNLACYFGKNDFIPYFSQFVFTVLMLQRFMLALESNTSEVRKWFCCGLPSGLPFKEFSGKKLLILQIKTCCFAEHMPILSTKPSWITLPFSPFSHP